MEIIFHKNLITTAFKTSKKKMCKCCVWNSSWLMVIPIHHVLIDHFSDVFDKKSCILKDRECLRFHLVQSKVYKKITLTWSFFDLIFKFRFSLLLFVLFLIHSERLKGLINIWMFYNYPIIQTCLLLDRWCFLVTKS